MLKKVRGNLSGICGSGSGSGDRLEKSSGPKAGLIARGKGKSEPRMG